MGDHMVLFPLGFAQGSFAFESRSKMIAVSKKNIEKFLTTHSFIFCLLPKRPVEFQKLTQWCSIKQFYSGALTNRITAFLKLLL